MALLPLARLSISLPGELLNDLDQLVAERDLPSRSQMIAELIRREIAESREGTPEEVMAGTLTLIYDAGQGRVRHALAQAQGRFVPEIISSQHVFLESDHSLEVLLLQGTVRRLHALRTEMQRIRGVLQTRLITTTTLLPPLHAKGSSEPSGAEPVARRS